MGPETQGSPWRTRSAPREGACRSPRHVSSSNRSEKFRHDANGRASRGRLQPKAAWRSSALSRVRLSRPNASPARSARSARGHGRTTLIENSRLFAANFAIASSFIALPLGAVFCMMHAGTGPATERLRVKLITLDGLLPAPAARGRTPTAPDKVCAEYPPSQRPSSAEWASVTAVSLERRPRADKILIYRALKIREGCGRLPACPILHLRTLCRLFLGIAQC